MTDSWRPGHQTPVGHTLKSLLYNDILLHVLLTNVLIVSRFGQKRLLNALNVNVHRYWDVPPSAVCQSILIAFLRLGLLGSFSSSWKKHLLPILHQGSLRAGSEPVPNRKFFAFWQSKNWLSARKSGSQAAPNLRWYLTKNRLHQGLRLDYCDQQD